MNEYTLDALATQGIVFGAKSFFATPAFVGASTELMGTTTTSPAPTSSGTNATTTTNSTGNSSTTSSQQVPQAPNDAVRERAARRRALLRPRGSSTSIVLGRFERLRALNHPNLCAHVALVRGKHERLSVVSEHYRVALRDVICNERLLLDARRVARFAREIVDALAYLAQHGVVHRNLHWRNVRVDARDRVKLADFGMYFVSDGGREVPFFIGAPGFAAPEVVCAARRTPTPPPVSRPTSGRSACFCCSSCAARTPSSRPTPSSCRAAPRRAARSRRRSTTPFVCSATVPTSARAKCSASTSCSSARAVCSVRPRRAAMRRRRKHRRADRPQRRARRQQF
jgi:serine/threonine protein kinase